LNTIFKIYLLLIISIFKVYSQIDPTFPAQTDDRILQSKIKSVWIENELAEIYPMPVKADYSEKFYNLYSDNFKPLAGIIVSNNIEEKAAAVINNQLSKYNYPALPLLFASENKKDSYKILIKFNPLFDVLNKFGNQSYSIIFHSNESIEIELSGGGERGLIYAAASLSQLVCRTELGIQIRSAEILDYPKFSQRIFNSQPEPYHLVEDLDWMLRYKIESITFHNKDYSWYGADEKLKNNLAIYKNWKKQYYGVNALLMLNLYTGDYDIEITNDEHLIKLKEFISSSYISGVNRFMINADDAPPFEYGAGYILTSEKDKAKFATMAEAHCWLMNDIYNWAKENKYEIELLYCPGFYTYEEMHYGDMELFKETPWEEDAFGPLRRDLKIIGEQMHEDIEIMWTGPYVCTRILTDNELDDWTNNLQGRAPFLFDNTIFSQLEFTTRSMFTSYENNFPENFSQKTGGNGIFLNGEGVGETNRAQTMTANAYMWEEYRYSSKASIIDALRILYGKSMINTLLMYREVELELCKTIKQRELWFVADELWNTILKTRFITEKNPFYYHQNYGRFKALRLQLKNSVPQPKDKREFINSCMKLDLKRKKILKKIEKKGFLKLSFSLQAEMVNIPSFEGIK